MRNTAYVQQSPCWTRRMDCDHTAPTHVTYSFFHNSSSPIAIPALYTIIHTLIIHCMTVHSHDTWLPRTRLSAPACMGRSCESRIFGGPKHAMHLLPWCHSRTVDTTIRHCVRCTHSIRTCTRGWPSKFAVNVRQSDGCTQRQIQCFWQIPADYSPFFPDNISYSIEYSGRIWLWRCLAWRC